MSLAYPSPEFLKELFVREEAEIPNTSNAWQDLGEPFPLAQSVLFMNGLSSVAMDVRLVQGRFDSEGSFVPLHYGATWTMASSNAANETFKTETAFRFAKVQIKNNANGITVSLVVTGKYVS